MPDAVLVLNGIRLQRELEGPNGVVAGKLLGIAQQVEGAAKQYSPVDTGRLRSSITSGLTTDSGTTSAVIGTDVEYAPHVEFGTMYMGAQSFLRRALDDVVRSL